MDRRGSPACRVWRRESLHRGPPAAGRILARRFPRLAGRGSSLSSWPIGGAAGIIPGRTPDRTSVRDWIGDPLDPAVKPAAKAPVPTISTSENDRMTARKCLRFIGLSSRSDGSRFASELGHAVPIAYFHDSIALCQKQPFLHHRVPRPSAAADAVLPPVLTASFRGKSAHGLSRLGSKTCSGIAAYLLLRTRTQTVEIANSACVLPGHCPPFPGLSQFDSLLPGAYHGFQVKNDHCL